MKRILYILHCYHNRAGTEEHTKMLALALDQSGFETAILYPENGALHLRNSRTGETQSYPAEPVPFPVTPYRIPSVDAAFDKAIASFRPDVIHVQHFVYWPLSILERCVDICEQTVISFHDYYPITPYFTMQGADSVEHALSKEFSTAIFGQDITAYLHERKETISKAIHRFKRTITPSKYLADFLENAIGIQPRVIAHGIPAFTIQPKRYEGSFRFGYVGSMLPQKGWRSLVAAFRQLGDGHPKAELHIFGGGERAPTQNLQGVVFHGAYEQADLPRILSQFTVGIIPSVFAETFCLVLSEMWLARIPVAAARIGALPERIQDGVNGKLFTPGDAQEISETLRWFLENEDWKSWPANHVRLLPEMVRDYVELYRELFVSADTTVGTQETSREG